MPTFSYIVRASNDSIQKGVITSHNQQAALETLKLKGFHPLVVKPVKKSSFNMDVKLPGNNTVKSKDLVIFTRQFATMIGAGVPIIRSLTTMKDQTGSVPLKAALEQIIIDVQGGSSFSDALGKHPGAFSDTYVNMVRAGEAGGILTQILNRLALQVEKDSSIKSKFKGAMIYPMVVSIVAVCAVIFLMVGVIPKLASILVEAGGELPIQTKVIMWISNTLINDWYIIIAIIIILTIAFRKYTSTTSGKYQFHQLLLKTPIFGNIIMKVNVARFARTFSSLLSAGVSVIEALETTAGALTNVVIRKALTDAAVQIKNGQPISDSLASGNILPQIIIQMASVGEETGQLDTVLDKVADFYEEEVDTVIDSLASIIEPILIVALGTVVGVIVASVLGPIINIQKAI